MRGICFLSNTLDEKPAIYLFDQSRFEHKPPETVSTASLSGRPAWVRLCHGHVDLQPFCLSAWNGAVDHQQTDIWYSFLAWNHFGLVDDGDGLYSVPLTLAEYTGNGITQVGVSFSIPVRLTDNSMCNGPADAGLDAPYCYANFDGSGTPDFCASDVKNIWYHTFDIFDPDLVSQGPEFNQPAVYPDDFVEVNRLTLDSTYDYKLMTIEPHPIYHS